MSRKKSNWQSLKFLKNAKKSTQVFVLTLDNQIFISKAKSMIIFEKQKDCEDFIDKQDKNKNYDYISMWLNNVDVW